MLNDYESKPHSSICVNLALKYVKICRNAVGYIFEKLDCLKSGEKLE